MSRKVIESDFRSSKMGGGGGASQWPACKPFGDIHSICPWANTQILVYIMYQIIKIYSNDPITIMEKGFMQI